MGRCGEIVAKDNRRQWERAALLAQAAHESSAIKASTVDRKLLQQRKSVRWRDAPGLDFIVLKVTPRKPLAEKLLERRKAFQYSEEVVHRREYKKLGLKRPKGGQLIPR